MHAPSVTVEKGRGNQAADDSCARGDNPYLIKQIHLKKTVFHIPQKELYTCHSPN